MSKRFFTCFILAFFSFISSGQTYNWVKHNSISVQANPLLAAFPSTSDQAGNLITGSLLVYKQGYSSDYYGDVIIRKYNNAGSVSVSKTLTGKAVIKGVQTDDGGNIYAYGLFMDTLFIDPGNFILNTSSGFNLNSFIIKFSSSGNFIWKKNLNVTSGNGWDITTAKVKGNFIYAGLFIGLFQSSLKKFDLNGNETGSFNISPVRGFSAIDVDPMGNIFTAGSCQNGNIQFSNLNINCPYVYSLFFAKFNSSFACQWVKFVQDVTFASPFLICDNSGNAYATGDLSNNFVFDTIQTQGPHWVYDFYLAKIHSSGNFLWVREVPNNPGGGDAEIGPCNNLTVDNMGNVYFTGMQRGTINWGPFSTSGNSDVLVLKYNSSGNILWGKTGGGSGTDRGHSISLDNTGNILLSGNFENNAQFDTIAVNSPSNLNGFAAKLSNPPLGIINYNNNQPSGFSLSSYPNPFNPVTVIKYELRTAGSVTLKLYDILGNEIETLINEKQSAGTYNFEWNAEKFSSGIYLAKLNTGDFSKTIKLIFAK